LLLRCRYSSRLLFELRKHIFTGGATEDARRRRSNHVNHELHLLTLISPRKQREPCEELDQNAPERPHVNLLSVGEQTKHNIRCSVEARLDVCVHNFVFEATRAKVSNHNSRLVLLLHEDVLRFEITMDNPNRLQVF